MRPAYAPVAIKIAIAAPLTAGATEWGKGVQRGTELALADYAAELTSAGISASALTEDDQGDPEVAVDVANDIVADSQVMGVVGHVNSGCSIRASAVYNAANLTMITPTSTNPALTAGGLNNVFRTCATDQTQGRKAADTVLQNLGLKRAYVVDDSTPYGEVVADAFGRRFAATGGKVTGHAKTSDRDTDFSALVTKIKSTKPTVVYYGGIYNSGALLARQLKAKGVNALFVGADGLLDPVFVALASKSKVEGALCTQVGLPDDQLPGGVAFDSRLAALFPGQGPVQTVDAYAYDAAVAIIKGVLAVANESGTSALLSPGAREQVRQKVAASSFDGVTGHVSFSANGDTQNLAASVYRVKSGHWLPCAQISAPAFPSSIAHGVRFTCSGMLIPHHAAGSKAVTVRFYRKVGTKWVYVKAVSATVSDTAWYSTYSATTKLTPKGQWMAIAEHSDNRHALMTSVSKTITVK